MNVYMDAHGIEEAIILVVESGFPYRMREERVQRDPARLRAIYDRWDAILERVKDDDMPEPCCKKGSATMKLSLIHISEPTRRLRGSRMPSSA